MFSNKGIKNDVKLKINTEIEKVYGIKFLGVTLDSKLYWKTHIENVKAQMSTMIAILKK